MAQGYISVQPLKWLNLQMGNDRLFFGNGYRSMILSDAAFNYPFLKITSKFQTPIPMFMRSCKTSVFLLCLRLAKKKYFSAHYLSYRFGERLQVGLFEGIVWQGKDSTEPAVLGSITSIHVILFRPIHLKLKSLRTMLW